MVHRSNGFDRLRLIAATTVIWGHAYPLTGHVSPGVLSNGVQTLGVKVFFVISGFLITKSWQSDPDLVRFATKRFLRIMPGLVAICLLTVFAFGPVFTTVSMKQYFLHKEAYRYFWNVALFPEYALPGVFQHNVYPVAVNGSLWSLPVEVAMYVGVPILASKKQDVARLALALCAISLLVLGIIFVRIDPPSAIPVVWGTNIISALDTAFYFYAGAVMAAWRLDRGGDVRASLFMLVVAGAFLNHYIGGEIVLALVLPYAVISFGCQHIKLGQSVIAHRDYSYELYLYGFPIQQGVVNLIGPTSAWLNAAISLPLALLCAAISWHLIESRALASKPAKAPSSDVLPQPSPTLREAVMG